MQLTLVFVIFAAGLALSFAAFNYFGVRKLPEGNEKMSEIASAIRVGPMHSSNTSIKSCILLFSWLLCFSL